MASLNSLADEVYTITNRPSLVPETRLAIRKAIFKFHTAETFSRDLLRTRIQFSLLTPVEPNQYRYQLDLSDADQFPRFRRLSALYYPPELVPPVNQISAPLYDTGALWPDARTVPIKSIDNIFDTSYLNERPQYATIMGMALNLKLCWGMDYLDIFYYAYPVVPPSSTPDAPITSWICDQYQDCVIEEASAAVFKAIGKDDEAATYRALFGENLMILKATGVGEDQ